jgi:hypothetical protein
MPADNYNMTVTRDDFSKLLTLLKVFENYCSDCDIQNGVLRCRINDRQAIISMNLNSILETNSLQFSLIKQKINLLKAFEVDDNVQLDDKNIIIESNDSNYQINDPFSKMIFRKPVQKYLDNIFIPDSEFAGMIKCEEANLVFSYDISNYIKRRISNITQGFMSDIIKCRIVDNSGSLTGETRNHEDSSEFIKDIILNKEISDCEFRMIAMPYILDIASDMKLSVYSTQSSSVFMCKYEQNYYGVPITVYAQAKITSL